MANENLPSTFPLWTHHPYIQWQSYPEIEIDWPARILYHKLNLPNPLLPFWIRDEIVNALIENLGQLRDRNLIVVEVFALEAALETLELAHTHLFQRGGMAARSSDELDPWIEIRDRLERWLNEQLIAYRISEGKNGENRLGVNVLCKVLPVPIFELDINSFTFCWIPEKKLRERVAARRGIELPPPFWLRFQKSTHLKRPVKLIPRVPKHPSFRTITLQERQEASLVGNLTFTSYQHARLLPLVAREHIDVSLVTSEALDEIYCWVKHIGEHETWIIKGPEAWYPVPREAWVQVVSGERIVLGRTTPAGGHRRGIVPGSLVVGVEY